MGNSPTISLAFILKNEAESIAAVLDSYIGVADEIILGIDDSTTDRTKEICSVYTDKLFDFHWEDDFAKARNFICDKCSCDIILMPDGHEYLRAGDDIKIRKALSSIPDSIKVISLPIHFSEGENDVQSFSFPRPIMFRRNCGISWKNKVHNVLFPVNKQEKIIINDVQIVHRMPKKRLEERKKQREKMNVEKLEEAIKENPNDVRSLFYLGQIYAEMKQHEKSIDYFRQYLEKSTWADERLQAILDSAVQYISLDKYDEAKDLLLKSFRERWDRAESYFLLGWIAQNNDKLDEAEHWYLTCTHMKPPASNFFINRAMYSWLPTEGLMTVYNKRGNLTESLKYAKVLLQLKPSDFLAMYNVMVLEKEIEKNKIDKWVVDRMPCLC